jgi:Na+-driven multidrug efflux pump
LSKSRDLTSGSIRQHLIQLTIPMIFGLLSLVAFNLIDTYFVGQLGEDQLAALSFTFPVIMIIFSLIQGIGIGATALISRSIGKK